MEYPEIYEVTYLDKKTKQLKSFDKTDDIDRALYFKKHLIKAGHKDVHIQQTFAKGGKIMDNSQIGFRKLFLDTPIVYGREIEISMPNGEKRKSQFAIVDADNILASHNENNFSSTIGYPTINGENINDRNYQDDKNAQAKVIEVAQNLDPNILVSTSRTPSGTPIITKDGVVVSGNNRTMSLKLAIEQYPEKYDEYKKFLRDEFFAFGFKTTDTNILFGESVVDDRNRGETFRDNKYIKFKHPILVRIDYDFPEYNTTELSKYNKETKKSERPIDKAIKIGKILQENEGCKAIVSDLVGNYETFSQFYANYADQVKLRDTLISCNIITKNDLAAYFDERGFTENGKDLIENLLAGMVLNKDALIAGSMAGGRQFKNIVITSLPVLAKNAALGTSSLIDLLNKAFLLEKKIYDSGLNFEDYIVQGNMFDDMPEKNVLLMNRLLAEGRNKFKSSIEAYNQSAIDNENESLFGDKPTFQEMFDTYITNKIDPSILKLIDNSQKDSIVKLEPNTSDEFDKAIMDNIDPHDSWIGNIIKERAIKAQIYKQLNGPDAEKNKETERIFEKYKKITMEKSSENKDFLKKHIVFAKMPASEPQKTYLEFQYGDKFGVPKEHDKELQLELIKLGIKIVGVTSDNRGLIVKIPESENQFLIYDNGGEFNIENRTTSDFISPIGYDTTKGIIPPQKLAADILYIMKESKHPNKPSEPSPLPIQQTSNLLVGDNFFKANPDKILGVPYLASGRFGEVTKYKGDISAVDRIDAPMDFVGVTKTDDPLLSTQNENITASTKDMQVIQNIEKAIKEEEKNVVRKKVSKEKEKTKKITVLSADQHAETLSFEEVYKLYNPEINQDELKAWVWYKEFNQERLSDKWYNLLGFKYGQTNFDIQDLVTKGYLCYFRGEVIPAPLYYAENIWEKKSALENDKENIIKIYGQAVYENQKERLANVFNISYTKRLTLTDANFDNRLKILPISRFAQTFMIKTLNDGKIFKAKPQPKSGRQPGRPDFFYDGSQWKTEEFTELALNEAFCYWLVKYTGEYEIKKDVTYYDIINIYVFQGQKPRNVSGMDDKEFEALWQRKVNISKLEGDRLFAQFLAEWIDASDIIAIETRWNEKFNGWLPVDYNKIPVAFQVSKDYRNESVDIRPEKREAVANLMTTGAICLAYDVGVGKTWSAIFAIAQMMDAGYSKRPFLVVPNQTYKQWISELRGLLPQYRINDLYNLSKDYLDELRGIDGKVNMVDENSITVMTYEGFERLGFTEQTSDELLSQMYEILDQDPEGKLADKKSKKQTASLFERLRSLIGRGLRGTMIDIEDLGFDFVCYDEAHKMKKVFVGVKGEAKENGERDKNPYQIQAGGAPSSIALKGFMISQYILRRNNERNVLLLTATPFTNSPLEIYSVLTMIAYDKLKETGLGNMKAFFDNYVHATNELVINAKLRPERKQVVMGFNNLRSLQQIIRRFINYKTGESVNVPRPNKFVLPMHSKLVNGEIIELTRDEKVETSLTMSASQKAMMDDIRAYVESKVSLDTICTPTIVTNAQSDAVNNDNEEELVDATIGIELDESKLSKDEEAGVRTLRGMSYARNLALSPYLYECSGLGKPTYFDYIESSPKLKYCMEAVRSVKEYHEKAKTPVSGQVIYMDRGVEYFELIRQYLIKEVGYKPHEVGIIKSQMPGGKDAKEATKNLFLGIKYDETTGEFVDLPDEARMKIVIGSSTIKEGINLQKHSTVLYNLFVDWNPTDIKQLEGRIWRQGNLYNSVRIVTPLMEDSMDVFIFQKLQEKTSRIAEIWDTDGETNTFNLAEFDPSELKAQLVTDPMVLAEMQMISLKEKFTDDIKGVENDIKRVNAIIDAQSTVELKTDDIKELVKEYRPARVSTDITKMIITMQEVFKNQLDTEGKKMMRKWQRDQLTTEQKIKQNISQQDEADKPYWFDNLLLANRTLEKSKKEFLVPRKLSLAELPKYKTHLEEKIKDLELQKLAETNDEAIKKIAEAIIIKRQSQEHREALVEDRVNDFKKLNYLLDDKIIKKDKHKVKADSCPPVDKDGKRRIDKDAIHQLNSCIASLPQTKELYVNKDGEYTPERKALHTKIISDFMKDAVCIKQEKPIAILTGGAPGSGKSTFLKLYTPYLMDGNTFHIDSDEVRAKLPEYKGWNAANTHLETKDIVDEMIKKLGGECKFDVIYDGTMNKSRNYFPLINTLKNAGYDVYVIYIQVPKDVSEQRVLARYQKSGRYVPVDVVDEVFEKGMDAYNEIKHNVSGYVLVDGITREVIEKGGNPIPENRNFAKISTTQNFEKQIATDARTKQLKLAKAKAKAQAQRVRILKLGE